jgi:hypothetical protein
MLTRHARTRGRVVAATLGMVLVWGGGTDMATAALITIHFEGTVKHIDPELSSEFSLSDKLVGSYSYHSDTSDRIPEESGRGHYDLNHLSYTVGGFAYTHRGSVQGPPNLSISNDVEFSPSVFTDIYRISGSEGGVSHGPSVGPYFAEFFEWEGRGEDLFSNDSLPLTPPSLRSLLPTQGTWSLYFRNPNDLFSSPFMYGEFTSLTLAPVPVPGALLLFGSGVLGLAAFKRLRRTRQA